MTRLPFLLAVLATAAAPAAMAQTWPTAEAAASAHAIKRTPVAQLTIDRNHLDRRPLDLPQKDPVLRKPERLAVDIPAKAEWTSDDGLRIAGAKLAYRMRF